MKGGGKRSDILSYVERGVQSQRGGGSWEGKSQDEARPRHRTSMKGERRVFLLQKDKKKNGERGEREKRERHPPLSQDGGNLKGSKGETKRLGNGATGRRSMQKKSEIILERYSKGGAGGVGRWHGVLWGA